MNFQQFFIVIALVIPVFFLAHIIEYKRLSKHATGKIWPKVVYGAFVLSVSILGEVTALEEIWATGFPEYSADKMPVPNDSLNTQHQFLLAVICVLLVATIFPAAVGSGPEKPSPPQPQATSAAPPASTAVEPASANRTATVAVVTAAVVGLMLLGQRRRR